MEASRADGYVPGMAVLDWSAIKGKGFEDVPKRWKKGGGVQSGGECGHANVKSLGPS